MSNAASSREFRITSPLIRTGPASPPLVQLNKRGQPVLLDPSSPEYSTWYDEKGKRRQNPRRELEMLALSSVVVWRVPLMSQKWYANDPTVEVIEEKCDRCR